MARKKSDNLNKHKLDLSRTLNSLDTKDLKFYSNLTDEEKKEYAPLILMRFMSSAQNQDGFHEYFLTSINDIVNQDFWTLSKEKEFQHLLLCACGFGKKFYHQWIPGVKKQNTNKLFQFFTRIYPNMNNLEFEILVNTYTEEDMKTLCREYALEDKERDDLLKQFRNAKNNVSNE